MRHLFSAEGLASLAATMRARPLLAFDFDGTLAPIVARPEDARVPTPVAQRLQRLAAVLTVAIVSGRQVDDVRRRLQFEPAEVIGNHGAEDPRVGIDAGVVAALDGIRRQLAAGAARLRDAGVTVEDKGASLALHYRLARDRIAARSAIGSLLGELDAGLRVFEGKMVFNVVAAAANDKADAMAALVARHRARAAVFVGDDVNDEPVFERNEPSWFTVRVGHELVDSQARWFLHGPTELPPMLDRMLALAAAPGAG